MGGGSSAPSTRALGRDNLTSYEWGATNPHPRRERVHIDVDVDAFLPRAMSWNCVAVTGRTVSKLTPYVEIPDLDQEPKVPGRSSPSVNDPYRSLRFWCNTDPNSAPLSSTRRISVVPGRGS
jgi:hypothetical protein